MSELEIVPNEEAEQLAWVEGFPASGTRFSLVSTSNLWTDRKLNHNDPVKVTGYGRVKGMATAEDKDGSLLYVYKIEVNDAELQ